MKTIKGVFLILMFVVITGCTNAQSKVDGYWKSSTNEAPTLEIDKEDVIVGVKWSSFWTDKSGTFENVGTIKEDKITGTDSKSGDKFEFQYEIKAKKLIVTVEKDWLPSVFSDSSDKEKLTYKKGEKFIYEKTEKETTKESKEEKEDSSTEPEKESESVSTESSSSSKKNSAKTDNSDYIVYYMKNPANEEKSVIAAGYGLKIGSQSNAYVDVKNPKGSYFAQITDLPSDYQISKESFGKGDKTMVVYRNGSIIAEGDNLNVNTTGRTYIDVKSPEGSYLSQITDLSDKDVITIEVE